MALERLRILLADDHDILRDGLRALLEMAGDIEVIGEARTGREAVTAALCLQPDIILMDISLPELDGVEACRRIRQQIASTRVLFLTMHESAEYYVRAHEAGAAGYVIKRTASAELLGAVRAAARGDRFLSPSVAAQQICAVQTMHRRSAAGGAPADDAYQSLTSREREVLQLVAEGYSNQAIADKLIVSIKTVQAHRAAVMRKLGLRDVTHLVRYAVRRGLVDPER
jgi:DNA-binding NarL/FixJ family response regulator